MRCIRERKITKRTVVQSGQVVGGKVEDGLDQLNWKFVCMRSSSLMPVADGGEGGTEIGGSGAEGSG